MAKRTEKSGEAEGAPQAEGPSFEKALADLEEIVRELEAGEKPLEESLKLYERGVAALRVCHTRLDQAEQRIRVLVKDASGKPVLKEAEGTLAKPEE